MYNYVYLLQLGTWTCAWFKRYLMSSKYFEYLNLYMYLQIWKILVLDSSTSKSTWPQPWLQLTPCGLVMPYGVMDLSQHWLR